MTDELTVRRVIDAPPASLFTALADPEVQAAVDGSDMLRGAIDPTPPDRVTIATGLPNSAYEDFAQRYKTFLKRYGITLDASLITGIDPPLEVESALAAINTAHNHVSSDISLAQASADQKIVQSKRAVEIETLNAQAEVEPLTALAAQLGELKASGPDALPAYARNVRLKLYERAQRAIVEVDGGPK